MYKFFEDPGHGWLEVTRAELARLGILKQISSYSYQSRDGRFVYLEEDSDMAKFAKARGWVAGGSYSDFSLMIGGIQTVYHEDNRIRGLPPYQP